MLTIREARIGIFAAIITAVGSVFSEVGAITLVGGNILGLDQTLASAALQKVAAARFPDAMAIALVLLGLVGTTAGILTAMQFSQGIRTIGRAS